MKILYLTPVSAVGGEELSTFSLVREMRERGHCVWVYGKAGPMSREYQKAGANIFISNTYERNVRGIFRDACRIRRLVLAHHFDVIHSQSVLPAISSFVGVRCAGIKKPILIFHERGIHEYTYPVVALSFNFMMDLVIANSDHERKKLLKYGLMPSHCKRVHNCINFRFPSVENITCTKDLLGISTGKVVIGTVCRLSKQKGLDLLLHAFKKVNTCYKNTVLLIVGDGPLRGQLESLAKSLGIRDKVCFTGIRRDLHLVYPAFDIFVLASNWEPFGNVALEAAAYGKVVVLSEVGGLPETLINGKTGILVNPGSGDDLFEAIIRLIRDRSLREEMGRLGRKRVAEYFTSKRLGNEIETLYEMLLSDASLKKSSY